MSDWDEIKRLAADFQKIQLSSTLQKLSEPNCIELVNLLVGQQLINVIYTIDGKEYITPEHFRRELEDELYAAGGRANAVALAKTLNVDLSHVTAVAEQLAAEVPSSEDGSGGGGDRVHFVLGQLMTDTYLRSIATEINDQLAQKGQVSVFELASGHFDLPTDFLLQHVMQRYLGTIIQARQDAEDGSKFFTAKYIARCRARLRGSLAGLTLPTPVATVFTPIGAQDAMYHQLLAELAPRGVVTSRQKGALFVPSVYTSTQSDWVDAFYRQNGYLEFEAVRRLGVTAPLPFIKRQLAAMSPPVSTTFLTKCCVDARLIGQLESALEECIATGSYLDATTVLPSAISDEDIAEILAQCMRAAGSKQKATQLFGSTVLSTKFIDDLVDPCSELAATKAKQSVETGLYQQHLFDTQSTGGGRGGPATNDADAETRGSDRKDDRRRKATGGKGGGGTQGRETKTKSTKKHFRGGRGGGGQSDSEDDAPVVPVAAEPLPGKARKPAPGRPIDLIKVGDILAIIRPRLDDEGLEHLADQLAHHFVPQFTRIAMATAHNLYEATLQNSSADRRQTHAVLQERLNGALTDIRMYERGLKLLPSGQQPALVKYLLRTLCTDVSNELHAYAAAESGAGSGCAGITSGTDRDLIAWTPELRGRIVHECDEEYRKTLTALSKTLTAASSSVDEFMVAAEATLQACSMILKKVDKKKDRTLVLCHKLGLLDKLAQCTDPALVLHLAVLAVFTVAAQSIVHASGKHVSAIIAYLQPTLTPEQSGKLQRFHDLVLKLLTASEDAAADESRTEALAEIDVLMPQIKELAVTYKKVGTSVE